MGGGFPLRGPPPPPQKTPPQDTRLPPPPSARRELFPSPLKVSVQNQSCPYVIYPDLHFDSISLGYDVGRESTPDYDTDFDRDSDSSIRTEILEDMLPRIPSHVQIVEIEREEEKDTQSVLPLSERERELIEDSGAYESISLNDFSGCTPTRKLQPEMLDSPPLTLFVPGRDPPLSHAANQPVHAAPIEKFSVDRGVRESPLTGRWVKSGPMPRSTSIPTPEGRAGRARRERSACILHPLHGKCTAETPVKGRSGRKTLKSRIVQGFRRLFRRRSPPPLPIPPPVYINVSGHVVNNVNHPVPHENKEDRGRKCAFARIKIFRRPILTYALLDTGNLSRCLLSEEIWQQLKLPLAPTRQKLRSADGSDMRVMGCAPPFKIYFEGMRTPVEITDALVVRGLTVPLNFSMSQIEKVKGIIDCTTSPDNKFRIKKESTPLLSISTPYSKASLDTRFNKILSEWKKENVTDARLQGKSVQVSPPSSKNMSTASPVIPPNLQKILHPSPRSAKAPEGNIKTSPSSPSAQLCCGVEPSKEREREEKCSREGQVQGKPSGFKVCDFSPESHPTYLAQTTPLSPNSMTWVKARVPSLPSHLKSVKYPTLFSGDSNRNYFIAHQVVPVSGIYSTQLDTKEVDVLISNRSSQEILLPCSLKLGSIQRAEKLVEFTQEVKSEDPVHQIDHRPENKLSAAEKQERWKFLRENVDLSASLFTEEEKTRLLKMLYDNFDAVSVNDEDFGESKTEVFKLKLKPGTVPHRDKCRQLNPRYLEDLDRQLREWTTAKIIEPSRSPWAAALVPVRKKGTDRLRWAVDYRKLNESVVTDSYPLPSIEGNLQKLHQSRIFTCLDSAGAFHGISIDPATRPMTAFTSPRGLWQFCRMPFGIKSSPSCYARMVANAMDSLPGDPGSFALAYLDDILVHSKTPKEHLDHLEQVLKMHKQFGMKLKLAKCAWGRPEADYLGHTVGPAGISMNKNYVRRVLDWPLPTTVAELRSFLGTVGYYRAFFPRYGILTAEMEGYKSQKGRLVWEPEVIKKFEELKRLFTQEPVRSYPDFSPDAGRFVMETDWSAEARSAVLLQEDKAGGPAKFIGCIAAKNGPAAKNYSSNKGELASVILGLLKFEHLLTWRPFKIVTDNAAVSFLRNLKSTKGIYSRWKELLAAFDFEIEHRPGKSNFFADALSRRSDLDNKDEIVDEITEEILDVYNLCQDEFLPEDSDIEGLANIPLIELQSATAADPTLKRIMQFVQRGMPPTPAERKKMTLEELPYMNRLPTLFIRHQVLMTYAPDNLDNDYVTKICLPEGLWDRVFQATHSGGPAGHHGVNRTYDLMRGRVYFPNMKSYVDKKVNGCVPCFEKLKKPPAKKHVQHREHLGRPGARVYADLVGPLQKAHYRGEEVSYILTVLDGFTRLLTAIPLKDITAPAVTDALVEHYIYVHGVPETVHTDNGVQFVSQTFKDTMKIFNIKHTTTPTYHPEGNRVERYHRTLMGLLRCESPLEGTWVDRLPGAVFAMNSAVNRITRISPYEATYGRPARIPLDAILPPETRIEADRGIAEYVRDKQVRMRQIYQHMITHEGAAIHRETVRDMTKTAVNYSVGDRVSLYSPRPTPGVARKLQKHWHGPYRVVKLISPSLIRIRPEGTWTRNLQDVDVTPDRLKKWGYTPTPAQMNTAQPEMDRNEDLTDEIELVSVPQDALVGLGQDGLPPRPARNVPGPVLRHHSLEDRIMSSGPDHPVDTTVKPSTAFPDVTLPKDPPAPPPFNPVEDLIMPSTPSPSTPPFPTSTPAKNPVSMNECVATGPSTPPPPPPPPPLTQGNTPAPDLLTSRPPWRAPTPAGAEYSTPSHTFPIYRLEIPEMGESPMTPGVRRLDFIPEEGREGREIVVKRNLPPTPLTHPTGDELEMDLDPLPIAALPLPGSPPSERAIPAFVPAEAEPTTGDTPPPHPPDPPPDTPPCPPPIQPLIDSAKRQTRVKKKLPPLPSPPHGRKKTLPPLPPRITRRSSREIERIRRWGDVPDDDLPAPSPSRKRNQPESENLPVVLRETRRRISETAEEDMEPPSTPTRSGRSRSTDTPRARRSASKTRRSLIP